MTILSSETRSESCIRVELVFGFGDVWILLDGWSGICQDGARRIWETQHAIYDIARVRAYFLFLKSLLLASSLSSHYSLSLFQYPKWERGTDVRTHNSRISLACGISFRPPVDQVFDIQQNKPKQHNTTYKHSLFYCTSGIFLSFLLILAISILFNSSVIVVDRFSSFVDSSLALVRPFFKLGVS